MFHSTAPWCVLIRDDGILALNSPRWLDLVDAYGSAKGLPELIKDPKTIAADPGDLWGRLCHQGDVYEASFAAVPYLVESLEGHFNWSTIALIAAIEVGRVAKQGAQLPNDLASSYFRAIHRLPPLLSPYLTPGLTETECRPILAAMAASVGQTVMANVLLNATVAELNDLIDE